MTPAPTSSPSRIAEVSVSGGMVSRPGFVIGIDRPHMIASRSIAPMLLTGANCATRNAACSPTGFTPVGHLVEMIVPSCANAAVNVRFGQMHVRKQSARFQPHFCRSAWRPKLAV
jgi:hypothetical protein